MSAYRVDFSIGPEIGRGHYGVVCRGSDPVHGLVAIKSFSRKTGESADEWNQRRKNLLSEGEKLKRATHQNIVQVFNVAEAETGDSIHLVMEFCSGGCLNKRFQLGPMTTQDVRRVATDVLRGLSVIHTRGLLHRDIKPANILLDDRGIAKIGDFGWVTDDIILGYAKAAGYTDHLPLEVLQGKGGTSVKSDLWAVGMTIYRLLHGQDWYAAAPKPRTFTSGGLADQIKWLPHIPKNWRTFIRKSLNDDPLRRFASVSEAQRALGALPVEKAWNCTVASDSVAWEREVKGRRINVTWDRSGQKQMWVAWSEPANGIGQRKTLARSARPISRAQCEKELANFFAG